MKIHIALIGIMILALAASACSGIPDGQSELPSGEDAQGSGEQPQGDEIPIQPAGTQSPQSGVVDREMPLAMTLALGTLKLEQTEYPVDSTQAGELLTLWKAARTLSESETTAAEEIQAIIKQIEETMTPQQTQSIEDMQLSFEDTRQIYDDLGIEFGGGGFGNLDPEIQATIEAARESGQSPPGGFGGGFPGSGPGGPGGGFGGGEFSPEARQTAIAERGGFQRAGLGIPRPLLDALIDYLETKAN